MIHVPAGFNSGVFVLEPKTEPLTSKAASLQVGVKPTFLATKQGFFKFSSPQFCQKNPSVQFMNPNSLGHFSQR